MATLERVRVHPIKALDAVAVDGVDISPAGGLEWDRAYAIRDGDGSYVNGKRTATVHRLRADVDLDASTVTVGDRESGTREPFHLDRDRPELAEWLSSYFGYAVDVEAAHGGELTDSRVLGGSAPGATVVSTETLETVASWFDDVTVDGVRRRFRANLEVSGVGPFWEDRLVSRAGDGTSTSSSDGSENDGRRLRVGDVTLRGVKPVSRCVVPTRDPDTGEPTPGFRSRFVTMREETFPAWADRDAFDHYYALTVLAVPEGDARGRSIDVGDPVEVLD